MTIRAVSLAVVGTLALPASAPPALAQSRPYAPALPCRALVGIVASSGAVIISTSRTTYDRYVANRSFCWPTQVARPAWVRAADTPQCFLGYTCREFDPDDWY